MERAQIEAEDMARAGDFAEAMHILLLRSVSELRRRVSAPIAESMTSREILKSVAISPEERAALSEIVAKVEISYFGAHRPEADEYAVCRRGFDALIELLRRNSLS
jgi:hypothetical protein